MHSVRVERRIIGVRPEAVFDRIVDFESYPQLTDAINKVTVDVGPDGELRSHWSARFRNGTAEWVEVDSVNRAALETHFVQESGDFEVFTGYWRVTGDETGAVVLFDAKFDMGMPSLAELVNPVAERALRENISQLIDGFATAEGSEATDLAAVVEVLAAT